MILYFSDVDVRLTILKESRHRSLWLQQITDTLTGGALFIILQVRLKINGMAGDWIYNN